MVFDQMFIFLKLKKCFFFLNIFFLRVTNEEVLNKFLNQVKDKIKQDAVIKLSEAIETLGDGFSFNSADFSQLSEKINRLEIKTSDSFGFTPNSMMNCFKEMNSTIANANNENQPEIPNFEDFIHLNEKSNKEKFFKGLVFQDQFKSYIISLDIATIANIDYQDLMSDHEHNRHSLIITNPKSVAHIADLQSNANYENALQIVKANVNSLF